MTVLLAHGLGCDEPVAEARGEFADGGVDFGLRRTLRQPRDGGVMFGHLGSPGSAFGAI